MGERDRDGGRSRREEGRGPEPSRTGGSSAGSGEGSGRRGTSLREWAVAALGAVIVAGTVGFMLYEAIASPQTPPIIEVLVDSIVDTEHGPVVQIRVRNHGQRTAAGLHLEGQLRSDTGTVETSQVTIDYVPAQGSRRGGLLFTHDPRRFALEIRATGYDQP